jgi:hypothetical protein
MSKINHLLGVTDQSQTFRKNNRNKIWLKIWEEEILPELSSANLIFYVLQSSSLVLAVLMPNQNNEKKSFI